MRAMTASLARTYETTEPRLAVAMGDLQVLPDGGAFIGWGTTGYLSEVAPDGTVRFDARFTGGGITYRAFRDVWTGRPTTRPAAVITRDGSGAAAVAVSWNGATAVDRWQVRQGARKGALQPVAVVPRSGFETTIPLTDASGVVAVAALDAGEKVLGVSNVVQVAT
jgi:hypothetical protein